MGKPNDLVVTIVPRKLWGAGSRRTALDDMYAHYTKQALGSAAWYLDARKPKRSMAMALRFLAIAFSVLAGALPLLAEVFETVRPIYAILALAVAAAFVFFDRFFGYSSAWMRYVQAETRIRGCVDVFQVDWESEMARWGSKEPTDEQLERALSKLEKFVAKYNHILQQETDSWITEFRDALKSVDDKVKPPQKAP